jgi:hypothetical protein
VHQVGCKISILYHDARSKIHEIMSKEGAMARVVDLSGHIPGETEEECQMGCLVSGPTVLAGTSPIYSRFSTDSSTTSGKRHVEPYYQIKFWNKNQYCLQ